MGLSTLDDIREGINGIDQQIISLLTQRQTLVVKAGTLKKDEDGVRDEVRVKQVLERVEKMAIAEGLNPDVAINVYRAMIHSFITLELRTWNEQDNSNAAGIGSSPPKDTDDQRESARSPCSE